MDWREASNSQHCENKCLVFAHLLLKEVQTFHDFSHVFALYLLILPVFHKETFMLTFLKLFMYSLYVSKVFLL